MASTTRRINAHGCVIDSFHRQRQNSVNIIYTVWGMKNKKNQEHAIFYCRTIFKTRSTYSVLFFFSCKKSNYILNSRSVRGERYKCITDEIYRNKARQIRIGTRNETLRVNEIRL